MAAKSYYIKALMKEGGGGDHLSIGVRYPDGKFDRPITNNIFLSPGESTIMCIKNEFTLCNKMLMCSNIQNYNEITLDNFTILHEIEMHSSRKKYHCLSCFSLRMQTIANVSTTMFPS